MEGFYTMKDEGGEYFKTPIPKLGLVSSDLINQIIWQKKFIIQ